MAVPLCGPLAYSLAHLTVAVLVAGLLPLLGLCRRLHHSQVLQLVVAAQAFCYLLTVCSNGPGAGLTAALQPAALYAIGGVACGALLLQVASFLLSWYATVCGTLGPADALFNTSHAVAAVAVGGGAHLGWDLLLLRQGVVPSFGSPLAYAWDLVGMAAGLFVCWELGGISWRHVRLKILLGAYILSELFLLGMRFATKSASVYAYISFIAPLLQLILVTLVGHLERHDTEAPRPHNPLSPLLRWAAPRRAARDKAAAKAAAAAAPGNVQLLHRAADGGGAPGSGTQAGPSTSTHQQQQQQQQQPQLQKQGSGVPGTPLSGTPRSPGAAAKEEGSHDGLALDDVLAVCRLPALGRLFLLHQGPEAKPGQGAPESSAAYRLPFKHGEADKKWSGYWGEPMLLGSSLGDSTGPTAAAAAALMGHFTPSYSPPGPTTAAAEPDSTLGAGPSAGQTPDVDPATLVALEGIINRIRPLVAFQQGRDRRRRPIGAHVTLIQHPMLDESATHSALRTIYAAVTSGQARALWPVLPRAPAAARGAVPGGQFGASTSGPSVGATAAPAAVGHSGGAGAVVGGGSLSARDTNEGVLLQALGAALPEQHVVAVSNMPVPLSTIGGGTATPATSSLSGLSPQPGASPGESPSAAAAQAAGDGGGWSQPAGPTAAHMESDESGHTGSKLLPTDVVNDLRDLIRIMQLGAVSIRFCPRAALTAPTPCGRFVRVWAVAAPAPMTAAADAAAGAVTATGSFISSATGGSSIMSGMTYAYNTGASLTGLANVTLSGDSLANYTAPQSTGGFFLGAGGFGGGYSSGVGGASAGLSGPVSGGGHGAAAAARRRRRRAGQRGALRETTVTGGSLFTRRDGTLLSNAYLRSGAAALGLGTTEGLFRSSLALNPDGTFEETGGGWADEGPADARRTPGGAVGADGRLMEPGINPLAALTLDRMVSGMVTTYDDIGVGVGDVGVTHYIYIDEDCPNVAEAVVHSWLSMRGHSLADCRLAEAHVSGPKGDAAPAPAQQQQQQQQHGRAEVETPDAAPAQARPTTDQQHGGPAAAAAAAAPSAAAPAPAAPEYAPLVSICQTADLEALSPSELLEMVAWAAACSSSSALVGVHTAFGHRHRGHRRNQQNAGAARRDRHRSSVPRHGHTAASAAAYGFAGEEEEEYAGPSVTVVERTAAAPLWRMGRASPIPQTYMAHGGYVNETDEEETEDQSSLEEGDEGTLDGDGSDGSGVRPYARRLGVADQQGGAYGGGRLVPVLRPTNMEEYHVSPAFDLGMHNAAGDGDDNANYAAAGNEYGPADSQGDAVGPLGMSEGANVVAALPGTFASAFRNGGVGVGGARLMHHASYASGGIGGSSGAIGGTGRGAGAASASDTRRITAVVAPPPTVRRHRGALSPEQRRDLRTRLYEKLMEGAIDGSWIQVTHDAWRRSLRRLMLDAAESRRRAAAEAAGAGPPTSPAPSKVASPRGLLSPRSAALSPRKGAAALNRSVSMPAPLSPVDVKGKGPTRGPTAVPGSTGETRSVSVSGPAAEAALELVQALLGLAADWCQAQGCVTIGTTTILRQAQRVCLEAAIPALLAAVLDCAKHSPAEFLTDVDLMTVYLEQIGLAGDVEQFFGVDKFRLGRILWLRHRATLPPGIRATPGGGRAGGGGTGPHTPGSAERRSLQRRGTIERALSSRAAELARAAVEVKRRGLVAPDTTANAGTAAAMAVSKARSSRQQVQDLSSTVALMGDDHDTRLIKKRRAEKLRKAIAADREREARRDERRAAAAAARAAGSSGGGGGGSTTESDSSSGSEAGGDDEEKGGAEHAPIFSMFVGNGLFWILPFLLQWGLAKTIGSGIIDNGRLDPYTFEWYMWAVFLAYMVAGGYFALLMHLQLYHKFRYSMPSMLVAMVQGVVSSLPLNIATGIILGIFVAIRTRQCVLALFVCAAYFVVACYVTLVLYLFCSSNTDSHWASASGRSVLALFFAQGVLGQVSYRLSRVPMVENLALIATYAVAAGALLWRSMRSIQQLWADALSLRAGEASKLSRPALTMLLLFHNATFVTDLSPESPPEDVDRAAVAAAQLLARKLQALRRLRLPLFYDERAWMFPVGALTHCMITIPFWLCELFLSPSWLGANGLAIALSYLFAMLGGAWLEWLLALENRGPIELSNQTRAQLAAAAQEMQKMSAAGGARGCGWGAFADDDDVEAPKSSRAAHGKGTSCLPCSSDGEEGSDADRGCAAATRTAFAPPGARCVPRGESYFIGCQAGFYPLRAPGSKAAGSSQDGEGYWRQFARFVAWQVLVWLAGLLVLMGATVGVAAGPGLRVRNGAAFIRLVWRHQKALTNYSLLCFGYAAYLAVGFNTVLGYGVTMKESALAMAGAMAGAAAAASLVPRWWKPAAEYAPAAAVAAAGGLYLALSLVEWTLHQLERARRSMKRQTFTFQRIGRLQALQTSGQTALSTRLTVSLIDAGETAAALTRMRNTASSDVARLTPGGDAGKRLSSMLRTWASQIEAAAAARATAVAEAEAAAAAVARAAAEAARRALTAPWKPMLAAPPATEGIGWLPAAQGAQAQGHHGPVIPASSGSIVLTGGPELSLAGGVVGGQLSGTSYTTGGRYTSPAVTGGANLSFNAMLPPGSFRTGHSTVSGPGVVTAYLPPPEEEAGEGMDNPSGPGLPLLRQASGMGSQQLPADVHASPPQQAAAAGRGNGASSGGEATPRSPDGTAGAAPPPPVQPQAPMRAVEGAAAAAAASSPLRRASTDGPQAAARTLKAQHQPTQQQQPQLQRQPPVQEQQEFAPISKPEQEFVVLTRTASGPPPQRPPPPAAAAAPAGHMLPRATRLGRAGPLPAVFSDEGSGGSPIVVLQPGQNRNLPRGAAGAAAGAAAAAGGFRRGGPPVLRGDLGGFSGGIGSTEQVVPLVGGVAVSPGALQGQSPTIADALQAAAAGEGEVDIVPLNLLGPDGSPSPLRGGVAGAAGAAAVLPPGRWGAAAAAAGAGLPMVAAAAPAAVAEPAFVPLPRAWGAAGAPAQRWHPAGTGAIGGLEWAEASERPAAAADAARGGPWVQAGNPNVSAATIQWLNELGTSDLEIPPQVYGPESVATPPALPRIRTGRRFSDGGTVVSMATTAADPGAITGANNVVPLGLGAPAAAVAGVPPAAVSGPVLGLAAASSARAGSAKAADAAPIPQPSSAPAAAGREMHDGNAAEATAEQGGERALDIEELACALDEAATLQETMGEYVAAAGNTKVAAVGSWGSNLQEGGVPPAPAMALEAPAEIEEEEQAAADTDLPAAPAAAASAAAAAGGSHVEGGESGDPSTIAAALPASPAASAAPSQARHPMGHNVAPLVRAFESLQATPTTVVAGPRSGRPGSAAASRAGSVAGSWAGGGSSDAGADLPAQPGSRVASFVQMFESLASPRAGSQPGSAIGRAGSAQPFRRMSTGGGGMGGGPGSVASLPATRGGRGGRGGRGRGGGASSDVESEPGGYRRWDGPRRPPIGAASASAAAVPTAAAAATASEDEGEPSPRASPTAAVAAETPLCSSPSVSGTDGDGEAGKVQPITGPSTWLQQPGVFVIPELPSGVLTTADGFAASGGALGPAIAAAEVHSSIPGSSSSQTEIQVLHNINPPRRGPGPFPLHGPGEFPLHGGAGPGAGPGRQGSGDVTSESDARGSSLDRTSSGPRRSVSFDVPTHLSAGGGAGGDQPFGGRGGSGSAPGAPPAPTMPQLFAEAYPDAAKRMTAAADAFEAGGIRVWLVPFSALNPEGCPPQFYALAVSARQLDRAGFVSSRSTGAGGLDVFVALDDLPPRRLDLSLQGGATPMVTEMDDGTLARVAEAVVHEAIEAAARANCKAAPGQSLAHLDACVAEAALASFKLPKRIASELCRLNPEVLAFMARRTPQSIVFGATRALAAAAAVLPSEQAPARLGSDGVPASPLWGDHGGGSTPLGLSCAGGGGSMDGEVDVLEGLDSRLVDATWGWLSARARTALLRMCHAGAAAASAAARRETRAAADDGGGVAMVAAGDAPSRHHRASRGTAHRPDTLAAPALTTRDVLHGAFDLLAALEIQQLGAQVSNPPPALLNMQPTAVGSSAAPQAAPWRPGGGGAPSFGAAWMAVLAAMPPSETAVLRRHVARAALISRVALLVHDTITGGARKSWAPASGAGARLALAGGGGLGGGSTDGTIGSADEFREEVVLSVVGKAANGGTLPDAAAAAAAVADSTGGFLTRPWAQEEPVAGKATGVASWLRRRKLFKAESGGSPDGPNGGGERSLHSTSSGGIGGSSLGRRFSSLGRRKAVRPPLPAGAAPPPPAPPLPAPPPTRVPAHTQSYGDLRLLAPTTPGARSRAGAPSTKGAPSIWPGKTAASTAGSSEQSERALPPMAIRWRDVPLLSRIAFHIHIWLRTLFLAMMGDPAFWQDASDLLEGGEEEDDWYWPLSGLPEDGTDGGWRARAGRMMRVAALRPLALLARLMEAMVIALCRVMLWRWRGIHQLLLDCARTDALCGVSVHGRAGELQRTLRFDRTGMFTAFYRSPTDTVTTELGQPGELSTVPEEGEDGGTDVTEEALCQTAGRVAAIALKLPRTGQLVMVDTVPGAVTLSTAAAVLSTTCYWVVPRHADTATGTGARGWWARARPGAARRPAWLPLWQWHRAGQRVAVWDYSAACAAAAAGSQQSAFEGKADAVAAAAAADTAASAVDGIGAAPATVRVFACGSGSRAEAFDAIERMLAEQEADFKSNHGGPRAPRRLRSTLLGGPTSGSTPPNVTLCYGPSGALVEVAVHQTPARIEGSAASAAAAAAGGKAAQLSATAAAAAAGVRVHLNFEPRPPGVGFGRARGGGFGRGAAQALAAAARPLAAVGSVFLDLSHLGLGAGTRSGAAGELTSHLGTHTATLLFSGDSALAQESMLPPWVLRQLSLADRAAASSSRPMPPAVLLLRNAQGEQWLLAVDVLATAAVGANLGTLWPTQPQGMRCWYSRGVPLGETAAAAVEAAARPSASRRRPPQRAVSGLRSQVRRLSAMMEERGMPTAGSADDLAPLDRIESGIPLSHQLPGAPGLGLNSGALGVTAGSKGPGSIGSGSRQRGGRGSTGAGAIGGWDSGSGGTGSSGGRTGISGHALAAAAARWAQQSTPPEWLVALASRLAVPWAPSRQAAPWTAPVGLDLQVARPGRGGCTVAHTGLGADTGLNRAFVWLAWNQGAAVMDAFFRPAAPPRPPGGGAHRRGGMHGGVPGSTVGSTVSSAASSLAGSESDGESESDTGTWTSSVVSHFGAGNHRHASGLPGRGGAAAPAAPTAGRRAALAVAAVFAAPFVALSRAFGRDSGGGRRGGRGHGGRRQRRRALRADEKSPPVDGVLATICEELLLMREPLLAPYWRARRMLDAPGCKKAAYANVTLVQHAIGAALLSSTAAQHSHMAHSLASLAALDCTPGNRYRYYNPLMDPLGRRDGGGFGDTLSDTVSSFTSSTATGAFSGRGNTVNTATGLLPPAAAAVAALTGPTAAPLSAIAMDSGTWPMDGGGVATCREQVLQGADDVRWHVEAEVGHDLKVVLPKMRVEPYVREVGLTIQWDTQHDSPNQSTFSAVPYTRLTRRAYATTPDAIGRYFIPHWRCLLVAMRRANCLGLGSDVHALANAMVCMHAYFRGHDWDLTWTNPQVSQVFMEEFAIAAVATPPACRPGTLRRTATTTSLPGELSDDPFSDFGGSVHGGGLFGSVPSTPATGTPVVGGDTDGRGERVSTGRAPASKVRIGHRGDGLQRLRGQNEALAMGRAVNRGATRPPPLEDLQALFDLFLHYLKFLCVSLPADAPVIQASHHGPQALTGLVAQLTRGQSLQVWEHGVLLRERMIYLDCFKRTLLPPFVNEQVLRFHRAIGQTLLALADMVVPCNASFNTAWESWLGTRPQRMMPLLNALDIDHYPCLQDDEAPVPTACMLSHVYALKDIITAIRAAGIIVHTYGVGAYRLEVYGSLEFDAEYVTACRKLIKQLKLEANVTLHGLGAPQKVLSTAWVYLQSSISEGLPVSVIEAGLTGKCVVCTNVGGCAELLSNPRAGAPDTAVPAAAPGSGRGPLSGPQPPWFGRLVAPKDAEMMAYAQLEVMAFLPTLQVPKLLKPPDLDPRDLPRQLADGEARRQRQALGRLFRRFALDQFRMSRYILQHRQALFTAAFKGALAQPEAAGGD